MNNDGKSKFDGNRKCTIEDILNPDAKIPDDYREFAEKKGFKTSKQPSKIGPTGGLVRMDVKQDEEGGLRPGKLGFVRMSNGKSDHIKIEMNQRLGIAEIPPLTAHDWRLIDGEIAREKYR